MAAGDGRLTEEDEAYLRRASTHAFRMFSDCPLGELCQSYQAKELQAIRCLQDTFIHVFTSQGFTYDEVNRTLSRDNDAYEMTCDYVGSLRTLLFRIEGLTHNRSMRPREVVIDIHDRIGLIESLILQLPSIPRFQYLRLSDMLEKHLSCIYGTLEAAFLRASLSLRIILRRGT